MKFRFDFVTKITRNLLIFYFSFQIKISIVIMQTISFNDLSSNKSLGKANGAPPAICLVLVGSIPTPEFFMQHKMKNFEGLGLEFCLDLPRYGGVQHDKTT
jgi:hypothetical protein